MLDLVATLLPGPRLLDLDYGLAFLFPRDGLPVEAANVLLGDADGGSAAAQAQALLGQLGGALQPSLTLQLAAVQAQAQAGHAGDAAAVAETQTALTAAALARMTAPPDDPQPPMI